MRERPAASARFAAFASLSAIIAVNELLNKTLVCVLLRYNISELHHFIEIVYELIFSSSRYLQIWHTVACAGV